MLNYFKVLGLEIDASLDHVKKAFRTLAKQWHPDKNRNPGAEDRFKEIKAAYEYLQSDDRRDVHAADIRRHHASDKERVWPSPPREAAKDASNHRGGHQRPHAEAHSTAHDVGGGRRSKTHGSSPSPPWSDFGAAHKKRGQRHESAFGGAPPAPDGAEARPRRQSGRPKMDAGGGVGAFHRDHNAAPTFENVFDFMSFDPFLADILNMRRAFGFQSSPPSHPTADPKTSKKKTDPFGNPLPNNVDPGIYDWSAPRFSTNWTDLGDPEFFCHYCGRLMAITLLRRHEPKCARLGGSRKTWFLDPDSFNDDESVIHATRQKLAQRQQQPQQQQQSKPGEKGTECQRCGLNIEDGSAASHDAECKKQPEPPSAEEQLPHEGRSRSRSGPHQHHHHHHHHQHHQHHNQHHHHHGHGQHHHQSHHHGHHKRSVSAHHRPPWNNNFAEDSKPEPDTARSGNSDGGEHKSHGSHRRREDQGPPKFNGCEKCIARFGRHAGLFCSCSVSHCL